MIQTVEDLIKMLSTFEKTRHIYIADRYHRISDLYQINDEGPLGVTLQIEEGLLMEQDV